MNSTARCPRCDATVKHLQIKYLPIQEGSSVFRKGVVFLCAHCNTVLGAGLDPDASITEAEIPAKIAEHSAAAVIESSNTPAAVQAEPANTDRKRLIDWPIIRTQHELFENTELLHKGMKIYPPQGQPVGEILKYYGVIDEDILLVVLDMKGRSENKRLPTGGMLVKVGIISEDELNHALLIQAGIPMVDVLSIDIPPEITKTVLHAKAREKQVVPVGKCHDTLYLAVADPFTFTDHPFFTLMTGMKVSLVFAPGNEIANYLSAITNSE